MMYVFGWLLIIGAIGVWFLGLGLGAAPLSGGMFGLGVLLAALGAVVEAIKHSREAIVLELKALRETVEKKKAA